MEGIELQLFHHKLSCIRENIGVIVIKAVAEVFRKGRVVLMGEGDAPGAGRFRKEGSKVAELVEELIGGFGTSRIDGHHLDVMNHRSNLTDRMVRIMSRFQGTNVVEVSEVEEDL